MIRLLGVLFLLGGLLLLAAGGRGWAETRAREARVQRVEGVVVRVDEDPSPRVRAYHAVVEARGADGSRVEVRQLRGSDPPAHRVGERVPLLVDPRDPGESRLASEGRARWRPVWIQLALATAFLGMGAVAVRLGGMRIPGGRPGRWRGGRGTTDGTFRHTH
jgi:hypothetical protein